MTQNQIPNRFSSGSVSPISRRTIWIVRIVFLMLFSIWVAGAIYLHNQVKKDRAIVEKARQEEQHQLQRQRRNAVYQYQMQERGNPSRVQNAVYGN